MDAINDVSRPLGRLLCVNGFSTHHAGRRTCSWFWCTARNATGCPTYAFFPNYTQAGKCWSSDLR